MQDPDDLVLMQHLTQIITHSFSLHLTATFFHQFTFAQGKQKHRGDFAEA